MNQLNSYRNACLIAGALMSISIFWHPAHAAGADIQPKIHNGTDANIKDSPYLVALVKSSETDAYQGQFCGGTLIAKNWVLTAAHCVYDANTEDHLAPSKVNVMFNRSALKATDGEFIAVDNIVIHRSYNTETSDNDIALIHLKSSATATPVELLTEFSNQDGEGITGKALGWGVTFDTVSPVFGYIRSRTNLLQQVDLPITSNASCNLKYKDTITNNMMCAGFQDGTKDVCSGDSGGPLVVFDTASSTWRQVGIVSGGKYCNGNGTYGVYTRVKNYKNIISDAICSAEEKPATPTLNVSIEGASVHLAWSTANIGAQYQVIYSRHGTDDWHSIDMNQNTNHSVVLPVGSDYDVKISANIGNCMSKGYSNVERIEVF